ncbi:CCA tRNA nucleotidyltransferase 1, mitochondrial isoform X1 [Neocloeon triangulifer]|uniref:CCA tRNA nucleotidyltransferase 1, mitochondrial isoform X1 n=1 Tax=Neocloeon triangulifer TaxID=2078957 RepID=UPI00286F82D0|nr:CCA tRNA nucleotidyltransferase 1, mitochondrial isoform X1 [Neocloeon triangulifer]
MLSRRLFSSIFAAAKNSEAAFWSFSAVHAKPNMEYKRIEPITMQIDQRQLEPIRTPELETLLDVFRKYGFEIRVAGGAVRDLLMGITPHDLDFATTATPEQMKEMFEKENIRMINVRGESHGTITPRINDKENFEVTTLRIDVTTDGRHAEVQFTTDWQLDANRRDLTINCLFMGMDGTVYDYFNGIQHIKESKVTFVGDAVTRIQEDYLRILRYFRFYGRIAKDANSHDKDTLAAIQENASGLARISGERIWTELKRILEGNFACDLMKVMIEVGVPEFIGLPKNPDVKRLNLVWNNLKDQKYNAITLLSALISNQEEAWELHKRLKFSAYERDLLLFITQHHERKWDMKPLKPYQAIVAMSKDKTKDTKEWTVQLLLHIGQSHMAKEIADWEVPRFPVNGHMIKDKVSDINGKQLGLISQELRKVWVDSDFKMDSDELVKLIPTIADEIKEKFPGKVKSKK